MANGCYVIPGGWTLVGFAPGNPGASCFSGSTPTTEYEGPGGGACSCNCVLTQQPTCPAGPVDASYDFHNGGGPGSCGMTPITGGSMQNMGACSTDLYTGNPVGYTGLDWEYKPHEMGGSCNASATPNGGVTYSSQDTICTPGTPLCTPNTPCTPGIPSQYSVCIEQGGNPACPSPFSQKYTVGGAATFTCSGGCTCAVPPCTGTMKLYTDNMCKDGEYDVPASSAGTCVAPGTGEGDHYASYHYAPDPAPTTCTTGGSSNPQSVQLSNPMTLCCAP